MQTRQLGKDGPQVPVLGFGAWPIGGAMGSMDKKQSIETIHASISNGITLIDTAQAYRSSESILGEVLKGGLRDKVFLATKVSNRFGRADIQAAMENSLRQLQVDEVDLYQIHWWDAAYPIDESMDEMAKLQQAGKTRYLGVSNFDAEQMRQALQTAPFIANQPRYNLFDRWIEAEDIPFMKAHGIGILAHSPLGKGLLAGKYTPDHQFAADDERSQMPGFQGDAFKSYLAVVDELKTIAADKGISMVQLSIAWLLRDPAVTCVLIGAKSPAQVEEAAAAVEVNFSDAELDAIDEMLKKKPDSAIY